MNRHKRKLMKYVGYLLLWFISFTLYGQRTISGHITDAEDGTSIPAATVFISNTTVGTTTDSEGYYQLRIPGTGNYQLTVSHVGYQSVFKDIEPGNTVVKFDVALQSVELEELNVATRVRFRRTDINLFWKTILGKNPSNKTIQATNPEAVYYFYNPETRTLKVTCREPLQIVNYETGYQIQYVLDHFTHNYSTNTTQWDYQPRFTELEPENDRQKNNWEKKRREVYQISLRKFIKSLYNNTLNEDGFVLAILTKNLASRHPFRLTSFNIDKIISTNPLNQSKILDLSNLANTQVMLVCYGKPVTKLDLNALQYAINESGQWSLSGSFRNLLSGGLISCFSDGTYKNQINMTPMYVSEPINGLTYLLPIDFLPDNSTHPASADAITENVSDFDRIAQHFNNQLSIFPQEKIHLHTDRDVYISGEKIWFKAYVADALTHLYPTHSRYVYVELISPVDTLMHRVMLRPTEGMFYGHLPLTEYVPTGNYTLRAYTRYMENLGDDYFFKKNIRIENLATPINQQRPTANRGMLKDDFSISFFPEGGNLPEGVLSKVAFKALNSNGYPETVSGRLVDETGAEITSVATYHAGMGVFEYIPEAGKRIFLKCKNTKGLEKQFELPQPNPAAYSLAAYQSDNNLWIEINRSVHAPNIPYYLLAHCRGNVLYFSEWDPEQEDILFDAEEFPAGIIQFVLFDKQMNPLSERLVFSKNYDGDMTKVEFHTDKTVYEKREKVIATLNTDFLSPSPSGRVGVGLSVSITDDKDISVDSSTTILSTLLLSSELRGYIENPAYYLQNTTESAIALDYLMLTHGWRRYNIPEVVKGNPKHPQIPYQESQEISGKVKNLLSSRPVTNSEIIIMAKDEGVALTFTNENGIFTYQDFEYPDSVSFMIQALSSRGSDRVEVVVDKESFPKPIHAVQSPHLTPTLSKGEGVFKEETKSEPEANAFMVKAEQRSRYDEDMWVIN
ncbi:MAG: carboxypeptidase-like regulatory domain-containing protein, partial [Tannerella sp.]|nr:carboxypeptidase-like regulatory domain-containing protein [Tannerella sp.]